MPRQAAGSCFAPTSPDGKAAAAAGDLFGTYLMAAIRMLLLPQCLIWGVRVLHERQDFLKDENPTSYHWIWQWLRAITKGGWVLAEGAGSLLLFDTVPGFWVPACPSPSSIFFGFQDSSLTA